MNRNYILLAILLVALAAGTLFLPERDNPKQTKPEVLMMDVISNSRFVTTDQVAQMIIEHDPTLELIDVRTVEDYESFSLPGAVNIPLDSILTSGYQDYLGIEDMRAVFYSDDDLKADQAWVIACRLEYENIYVMKGGLNSWINTIIQPTVPGESDSKEAFELYNIRRGASMYFTGAQIEAPDTEGKSAINVSRKKKATVAEGGC